MLTRRFRSDDEGTDLAPKVLLDDEDFYPSMNSETIALLARAITDSEDEGGTPSLPTPGVSNGPSLENSDNGSLQFTILKRHSQTCCNLFRTVNNILTMLSL